MKIELRADGARLSGYANVTERKSRPVVTPIGRVIEEIERGAFARALERANNVTLTKDHDREWVLAETRAGTLELCEDGIGLHYDARITDPETIAEARAGKIRGMSFGMRNVTDAVEERAGELPLRRVQALDLDHIALIVRQTPFYSATSVELRADGEAEIETRSIEETSGVAGERVADNSAYRKRLDAITQN